MRRGKSAQGHVGWGQEGLVPRRLNPGPHPSPLSVVQSEAITQIATHAGFLLSDLGGRFLVARSRATEPGSSKGVAARLLRKVSQKQRQRRRFVRPLGVEECGRSFFCFLGNTRISSILQSLPAQQLVLSKSACPSVGASACPLRTPLRKALIGLTCSCVCCPFGIQPVSHQTSLGAAFPQSRAQTK